MKIPFKSAAIPVFALSILLLMVVWLAGGFTDKVSPSVRATSNKTPQEFFVVKSIDVATQEPISATITAKEATIVSSRTLARIESINVRAGETVKQGQLLISLEQKDVEAQVAQAQQQVKALSVRLAQANKNLKRTINLRKEKLVPESTVDTDQANVDALTAELSAAQQALNHAETVLSYNALVAPIDGVIVDRYAEPGDTAQPGKMLLTIYNPNSLRVTAQVRENLALSLKNGQEVQVELPSQNKTVVAYVEEIVPAANTGSRSFLVNVGMTAQTGLLPGMYAKLLLPTGMKKSLAIPADYVATVGQLTMVWVLENGEKQRRYIRIATEPNLNDDVISGMVDVISGLAEGDKLVKKDATLTK